MNFQCPKCDFNGNPNLEETGPHTKATCPDCGAYIKMISRQELDEIITATNLKWEEANNVVNVKAELTLTINTLAPEEYLPNILGRVKKSLERGFTSGESSIIKPFDEESYHYDFYYK